MTTNLAVSARSKMTSHSKYVVARRVLDEGTRAAIYVTIEGLVSQGEVHAQRRASGADPSGELRRVERSPPIARVA